MSSGRGDLRGAEAMDQGDDEIAQGGEDLRSMASAQAGAIFAKVDIAHIMETIFNAPMSTIQVQQALRAGLAGRKGGPPR